MRPMYRGIQPQNPDVDSFRDLLSTCCGHGRLIQSNPMAINSSEKTNPQKRIHEVLFEIDRPALVLVRGPHRPL